jgi:hypothetical protein
MPCVQWRRDYSGMDLENVPVMRRSQSAARWDKVPQWNGRRMVVRQMHGVRGERDNLKLGRKIAFSVWLYSKREERDEDTAPRSLPLPSQFYQTTIHRHACKAVWCASTAYHHMHDSAQRQLGI